MTQTKQYNVAIVGATGAVGRCLLTLLEERQFPVQELRLLASERSHGVKLPFRKQELAVQELTEQSFAGIDIAFFSAGADRSAQFVPAARAAGAIVIDNTSYFRMQDDVPLVVPEVNGDDIASHKGIIANPNCSTIGLVLALNPLHQAANIKRVVVSTYQSVSGACGRAIEELDQQLHALLAGKPITKAKFPHQIAGNVIPHIDVFLEDGSTKEEWKMIQETKKILHDETVQMAATCVRVPVLYAHAASVNIETEKKLTAREARTLLSNAEGVVVEDDPAHDRYPLPLTAAGRDEVFVGRIREDQSVPCGLAFWVVSDNLRKGAALNALQIAERLHATHLAKA